MTNYYLIINNIGAQPVKTIMPLRRREDGRWYSDDGTCSAIVPIGRFEYYWNKLVYYKAMKDTYSYKYFLKTFKGLDK